MSLPTESEILGDGEELQRRSGVEAESATIPVLIRLEDVSVEYRAPRERIGSFKEYAIRFMLRRVQHDEFKALCRVSLEIKEGEVFGIIGHNGAGKSTLLKIVSRVMKPTRGRVWVKGRIAPLLELGAGFHPELSGRENVYLNGALLGHTHAQMESVFDSIVDFAELREFIDAPLRTYSTGMAVRLGFAVATAIRPDILIVDEVLSVGDEQFQDKCAARISEFRASGTTILLVTHDSKLIARICDRAAWIDHGEVRAVGDSREVAEAYHGAYHPKRAGIPNAEGHKFDADELEGLSPSEQKALKMDWFYRFELPSGRQTPCLLPPYIARFHDDRWKMICSVLDPMFGRRWDQFSGLDIGCNQGFFSVQMAERGCHKVVGLDARAGNIAEAELIREIFAFPSLSFEIADITKIDAEKFGKFDVVLMLSLLFSLENPIGALRIARALTKRVLLIETIIAPEIAGQIDWGGHLSQKPLQGSFALIDQRAETGNPLYSLTGISLCPGKETLIWLLKRLGFSRVEVVDPPSGAYEQLTTKKRIMIAAYV